MQKIDFENPTSTPLNNESKLLIQDKRNRIQVPIETLNELSLYTTGSDYNGNDANMGYLVIEPKDSVWLSA